MFYVYAYFEPGGKVPFYIGKGVRHRSRVHLSRSHNSAVARKIAGIIESWRNPTTRENRLLGAIKGGAALRDRILANPAERRRLSEQMKRAWRRPAFRQRATAAAQTRFATAQARAEMSAKIR